MSLRGRLSFEPQPIGRALELPVCCEFGGLSQERDLSSGDHRERLPLVDGWSTISVPIPADADHVVLEMNKPYPHEYYPSDPRTLGVRVRTPLLHADDASMGDMDGYRDAS